MPLQARKQSISNVSLRTKAKIFLRQHIENNRIESLRACAASVAIHKKYFLNCKVIKKTKTQKTEKCHCEAVYRRGNPFHKTIANLAKARCSNQEKTFLSNNKPHRQSKQVLAHLKAGSPHSLRSFAMTLSGLIKCASKFKNTMRFYLSPSRLCRATSTQRVGLCLALPEGVSLHV